MAVSITSRPALWSAVKNPVVYKFATTGGPFTLYRIEVEVFDLDDNSLTGGVKFAYTPDPNGVTIADISAILRAVLRPDWAKPSSLSEAEPETGIGFYIKYQEVYDGSSEPVQEDDGNPRYAVFGGLQIPSPVGNSMENYVIGDDAKKALTLFEKPIIWKGYPVTASIIVPEDAEDLFLSFDDDGVRTTTEEITDRGIVRLDISTNDAIKERAIRIIHDIELLTDTTFSNGVSADWYNEGSLSDWSSAGAEWAEVDVGSTSGSVSSLLTQDYAGSPGKYRLTVKAFKSSSGVFDDVTFGVVFSDSDGVVDTVVFGNIQSTSDASPDIFTQEVEIDEPFEKVQVSVSRVNVASDITVTVMEVSLIDPEENMMPLVCEVRDACANPVMLFWKSSLGGDAWWLFENDQEVSYELSGYKAKRMKLRAGNLTVDQWEALNELNHIGEVYKQNIVEFTSSIDKSHLIDGAQVYVVQPNGDKVGVIVRPTNSVMFTRARRHEFEIEIEFPERYE